MVTAPFGFLADCPDNFLGVGGRRRPFAFLFKLSAIPALVGASGFAITFTASSEHFLLFKIRAEQFLFLRSLGCIFGGFRMAGSQVIE